MTYVHALVHRYGVAVCIGDRTSAEIQRLAMKVNRLWDFNDPAIIMNMQCSRLVDF